MQVGLYVMTVFGRKRLLPDAFIGSAGSSLV
jgi:hypothetical protein